MSVKGAMLLLFISLVITNNLFAQKNRNLDFVSKSIQKIVGEYTHGENIKDSTAIYSYAIKIDVTRKKNEQIVNVSINNPTVNAFFDGLDELKKVNYLPLMRKKKSATYLFQAYVTVFGSKYDSSMVKLADISNGLKYLFPTIESDMFYLGTVLIELDKKIYN